MVDRKYRAAALGALAILIAPICLAETVRLGLRAVPPYVYTDSQGRFTGLEHDIVVQALRRAGHEPLVSVYPYSRLFVTYRAGEIDAAGPASPAFGLAGTLSQPYLSYQNVVMTLAENPLTLSTVQDLRGLKVVAFQNARTVLGANYASAVDHASLYDELADQRLQVNLLMTGRVDAVVAERRILRYFIDHPLAGLNSTKPVREHKVFEPTPYHVVFRDPRWAADFDRGLLALMADGSYSRLLEKQNQHANTGW